jgi:hypothetical protein
MLLQRRLDKTSANNGTKSHGQRDRESASYLMEQKIWRVSLYLSLNKSSCHINKQQLSIGTGGVVIGLYIYHMIKSDPSMNVDINLL